MFCNECGAKNNKSAVYCSKCGKKLVEGDIENNTKNYLSNVWNHIKGMVLNPIDTAKEYIKDENYISSLIYLSVNVILVALFVLILFNSLSGVIFNTLGMGMYDGFYSTMEIPYFRVFLVSIMTVVVIYALMASLSYLICHYVFKSKTSFYRMISWLGINSVFNTIASIIMVLGMLISPKLGIIIYVIETILYTFNLYSTLEYATDTNKNKLGYVLMASILVTFLIVIVILPKIFF